MNNLLLLHGALGSKEQFKELEEKLSKSFNAHSISFSGHGGEPIPEEPFSIELFSGDVLKWMQENSIEKINIFGYSMGGYAALYLAKHHPGKINKIFTIATKFLWNEEIAAKEIKMLDPVKMKEKVPAFAEQLKMRHGKDNWEMVLKKTAEMMTNLGKNNVLKYDDFNSIEQDILLGLGDRDKMVTIEETVEVYKRLKNAQMIVLPNTSHPLEAININRLISEINLFFT